jgi:hypothetical protein
MADNMPKEMVKQYIELFKRMDKPYTNAEEAYRYFLEHGQEFNSITPSKEDPSISSCGRHLRRQKQCYYNSALCCVDTGAKYYEGFAVCDIPLPLEHAWNVKDGKVFDLTWEDRCKKKVEYFGMEIPQDFLRESMVDKGMVENLLWRYIDTKIKKEGKLGHKP